MPIHLLHREANRDLIAYWQSGGLPAIPAGAVLPFYIGLGLIPSGWTASPMSSTKCYPRIQGTRVGSMIEIVNTLPTVAITSNGSHTGTAVNFGKDPGYAGTVTEPNHNHGGTFQIPGGNYSPPNILGYYARCDADTDEIPEQACFLKADNVDHSGFGFGRTVSPNSEDVALRMLRDDTGGVNWYVEDDQIDFTLPTQAHHTHGGNSGGSNNDSKSPWKSTITQAGHNHGASAINLSWDKKIMLFNQWSAGATAKEARLGCKNMYAFWYDSETPPPGWVFLNGQNGTPDPSYCWPWVAYDIDDGGLIIDGTSFITGSAASPSDGSHSHAIQGDHNNDDQEGAYHATATGSHTHTLSVSEAWAPTRWFMHIIKRLW